MSQESNQHRIDTLRHQWRSEPTPRRTLQLAEEYGREGDLDKALEVLRKGLEQHPGHVASRVALGRYLLDADRPGEARGVLEQIALDDQTHLVANKLLVKSHLELGEVREARDRLDLYTLLNESDADIESFEARLAALESARAPEAAASRLEDSGSPLEAPVLSSEPAPTEAKTEVSSVEELASAGSSPSATELPDATDSGSAEALVAKAEPVSPPSGEEELFQNVWAGVERKNYWDSLGSDGIFALEPRSGDPEAAAPKPPPVEAAVEGQPTLSEAAEPLPVIEAATATDGKVVESTVTLGRLYLQQGHHREADRVFREVLEREPGNQAARAGLAAAGSKGQRPLTAADLVPADVFRGASSVDSRRQLLTAYLARLKPETAGA